METLQELGMLWAIAVVMIGSALLARRRLKPQAGVIVVVLSAIVAAGLGWVALTRFHERQDRRRLHHALWHAAHEHCDDPVPAAPDSAALQELMCAADLRFADLRAPGTDVSVTAHADLIGVTLPRVPAGKTYAVAALDPSGATVATLAIDASKPISYLRDPKCATAVKVRLLADGAPVTDAPLAR